MTEDEFEAWWRQMLADVKKDQSPPKTIEQSLIDLGEPLASEIRPSILALEEIFAEDARKRKRFSLAEGLRLIEETPLSPELREVIFGRRGAPARP